MTADGKTPTEDGSPIKAPQFPDLTKKKLEISKKFKAGLMSMEEGVAAKKAIKKEKKAHCAKKDKSPSSNTGEWWQCLSCCFSSW